MVETSDKFRFHRFGDYVAFFTEKTETLYVSAEMAKKLSVQFSMYAQDIEQHKFANSPAGNSVIISDEYDLKDARTENQVDNF